MTRFNGRFNDIRTAAEREGQIVCGTIRQALPCARKVKASHRKGEASFLCDGPVDEEALKAALDATGYRLLDVTIG